LLGNLTHINEKSMYRYKHKMSLNAVGELRVTTATMAENE